MCIRDNLRFFYIPVMVLLIALSGCSDDPGQAEENSFEDRCSGPYLEVCDGECIHIQSDPDHCGACGNVCGDEEACLAGQCLDDCGAELTMCSRRCVDLESDNEHCGFCNESCEEGMGCNFGTCVSAETYERTDDACAGGGPVLVVSDAISEDRCSDDLRRKIFDHAVCSCDRAVFEGDLSTDAFDSSLGAYAPGGIGGSIGFNDHLDVEGNLDVGGDALVDGRLEVEGTLTVAESLFVGQNLDVSDVAHVGADATVAGNMDVDSLSVDGTLKVPEGTDLDDNITYANLEEGPVELTNPCPCDELPQVAAIVDARRDDNDNDLVGLPVDLLDNGAHDVERIDLPCGHYFLQGASIGHDLTIVAHGRTTLYIDGNLESSGDLAVVPAPGAEIDVFVKDQIRAEGRMVLGNPGFPASTRIYVDDQIDIEDTVQLGGFLFGEDHISMEGDVEIFGGIFAGNLLSVEGHFSAHYDLEVQSEGGDGPSCPLE